MKRLLRIFRGNDIIIRIYLSFCTLLAITVILIGAIFLRLYQDNYLNSYTDTLNRQCNVIARRVGVMARNGRVNRFMKYAIGVDELKRAEETDVWIVSDRNALHPLSDDFTNADTSGLTEEMYQVLDKAFQGVTSSSSNFDKVYGMMILRVAAPIYADKEKTEVCGAVMLVSMLDRQRMGVQQGKYLITISALLALLVSYVVALGFSKYLSQPLGRIGKDIMRLAEGDYSALKVSHKQTQLGRLELALDELAGRLRQICAERENLDRVRQDFFANISHELRTPITVIRGYSESLADGVIRDRVQVEDYYLRIVQECQGMERLVGDLFILSKMQNPDFQIEKEPVSLVQIFSDVVRNGRVLGQEKGIVFETQFPEETPCLMLGDYDRLRQMFLVIVDNAVKFSKPSGRIEIAIVRRKAQPENASDGPGDKRQAAGQKDVRQGGKQRDKRQAADQKDVQQDGKQRDKRQAADRKDVQQEGRLRVSIRDYGVGISEEQLPYIFEKFYTSKLKQNEKGTGLGLMIARQIALRHDGDITVESTEGEGTTFYFEFTECSVEDAENQMLQSGE